MQTLEPIREHCGPLGDELWNYEPIDAFVLVAQRWAHQNSIMSLSFAKLFCKTGGCPTSQALLAYLRSFTNPNDVAYIERHLAVCDFCSAELHLLTRHHIQVEEYIFAEMPAPLRRLAEDLLTPGARPFKRFPELVEYPHVSH
jgi:hypothetical protein